MKRRVASIVLVVLAIWPLCHFVLVKTHDIDPWKLVGFAMYCIPGSMKLVRVVGVDEKGEPALLLPRQYQPEEAELISAFVEWRRTLGRLASDDELAARLLELHPDWKRVTIVVASPRLEPSTAMIGVDFEHNTHWRDGREGKFIDVPDEELLKLFGI
jgi:hypothetical protein